MDSPEKDQLLALYEAFEMATPEAQLSLQQEVLVLLQSMPRLDANILHIWGLTYYMSHEPHLELAKEKFTQALLQAPNDLWPRLYLGHCFHDQGKWEEALTHYQQVNQEELAAIQRWRYTKLLEQIGCCYHQMGQEYEGRKYFERMLVEYKTLTPADRSVPIELRQCLPETDPLRKEVELLAAE